MRSFIGGLFQTREAAYEAHQDLQKEGFDKKNIKILSRKRGGFYQFREGVSAKSVALNALVGAVIGTAITAFVGFLIGQGIINVPAFVPISDPFFTLNAFGLFLAQGAITGAILGVATRLAAARERPVFTHTGITHGGIILAVNAEENQRSIARKILKETGALDMVNLSEKWDQEVWSQFRELQPPATVG